MLAAAPPAINPEGVINAASQMPSQLPGGAIARGSLVRILGVRLGPGQVSVRVRKGRATVDAVLTDTSPARIDAILPASSPTGDVSLTVTSNGLTSAPFAVKVVESSFGIFTENGAGWGPATDVSAAPGEIIAIRSWLTVSGPEGSKSVTKGPRGPFTYWRGLGGLSPGRGTGPEPLFLSPGVFTITGRGDPDIGSFRAEAMVPAPLKWANRSQIDRIERGKDVAVTWSDAAPGDLVIVIAMNMDQVTGAMGLCACVAPGDAEHFTIPADRLANIPQSTGAGAFPSNLLMLARIPAQNNSTGRVAAAYVSVDSRTVDFR
jgi:uncharacterized protein (TIGR03437 family)